MNILFLCPRFPLPADTGGKIRTLNILKQLCKTNHVHLVCFSFDTPGQEHIDKLRKFGVETTLVAAAEPGIFSKLRGILFASIPFSIGKYHTAGMRKAIENLLVCRSFEAIHVDHLHMAHYTDSFRGIPCLLDEHNVEFKILERCRDVETSSLMKLIYQQQAVKMKSFESSKLRDFKGILACSPDDQTIIDTLTLKTVPSYCIPNGVDTEFFNSPDLSHGLSQQEDALVFTGSLDWLPNQDAVIYFCRKILPLIWQKRQTVKFYAVGTNPSKALKDLAVGESRIIVTGRVDDVRPYIRRSKIFVVPLRIGGGTRLKILEAMSMQRCVVSTSIGAEGIECTDGKNILLGDSPRDFADKVLMLLNEPQKSLEIGQAARAFVCGRYDWDTIGGKLEIIYRKLNHG